MRYFTYGELITWLGKRDGPEARAALVRKSEIFQSKIERKTVLSYENIEIQKQGEDLGASRKEALFMKDLTL